jgi:hypothetical protein
MQNIPKPNPEQRGISDNVDPNDGSALDLTEVAKSPYGNLEITKYLFESGLQNIFNTYQQNVATLSQNKKTELQDAYYIREMSKKYLGEYASNVGIGDVSGNLLDIYGQYQSNITDIQKNYGELELGLQQDYQKQRTDILNDILLTDYNIEVAKLDESDRNILFNMEMGNTGGLTDQEYLEQEYQAGRLTEKAYQDASVNIMNNERTKEEREIWGRIVRGEVTKEELTSLYESEQISEDAYNSYYSALEKDEKNQKRQSVEYNVIRQEMGGLTTEEYLQQELDNGNIERADFEALMLKYDTPKDPVDTAFEEAKIDFNLKLIDMDFDGKSLSEFIREGLLEGYIELPQAMSILIEDRTATAQRNLDDAYRAAIASSDVNATLDTFVSEGRINENEKRLILDLLTQAKGEVIGFSQQTFNSTDAQYYTIDEEGNTIIKDNPYLDTIVRNNLNKDAGYLLQESDSAITSDSRIIFYGRGGIEPSEYIVAGVPVSDDDFFELGEAPELKDIMKANKVEDLSQGVVYNYLGYNYIYEKGKIYRLIESNVVNVANSLTDDNMKLIGAPEADNKWFGRTSANDITKSGEIDGIPWEYKTNKRDSDTLMFNGVLYVEDDKANQFSRGRSEEEKAVIAKFNQIHGDNKSVVIFLNGTFWNRDVNGNYQKMIKK